LIFLVKNDQFGRFPQAGGHGVPQDEPAEDKAKILGGDFGGRPN
jgi:hypothetical protein